MLSTLGVPVDPRVVSLNQPTPSILTIPSHGSMKFPWLQAWSRNGERSVFKIERFKWFCEHVLSRMYGCHNPRSSVSRNMWCVDLFCRHLFTHTACMSLRMCSCNRRSTLFIADMNIHYTPVMCQNAQGVVCILNTRTVNILTFVYRVDIHMDRHTYVKSVLKKFLLHTHMQSIPSDSWAFERHWLEYPKYYPLVSSSSMPSNNFSVQTEHKPTSHWKCSVGTFPPFHHKVQG